MDATQKKAVFKTIAGDLVIKAQGFYKAGDNKNLNSISGNLSGAQQEVLVDYLAQDGDPDWMEDTVETSTAADPTNTGRSLIDLLTKKLGDTKQKPQDPDTGKSAGKKDQDDVVTEKELAAMWTELDVFDVTSIEDEVLRSFEYVGFNPEAVLKSMMKRKKHWDLSNEDFKRDVTILCGLAIIKGSVTDNNLKKMSDDGKQQYTRLETRYGITRGGGKNKPAEVITVARIAATFPGIVTSLLQHKKVPGRKFIGDLRTHQLPGVMQHQAFAAIVPVRLADRTKSYLLNLITAYSVEQTRAISKTKEDLATLLDRQTQFTQTAHMANYPGQEVKTRLFKSYNWSELLPMITPVALHIKTKWTAFNTVTEAEALADIGSLD